MGMDYRDADGVKNREFFGSLKELEERSRAIEAKGGKIERVVSIASVRDEPAQREGKYPAHQGQKEVERRLKQLLAAKTGT